MYLTPLLALVLCWPWSLAAKPRPLVIWHGLGDSYGSSGMLDAVARIQETHPGIFVHSVALADSQDDDRKAGFFGNVDLQLGNVSEQLRGVPQLRGGFDAIGFSQAGQFLRAYVERYNAPPVHNLITFGAQHMGVSDLPACRPFDVLCQISRRAAQRGVYSQWAQENIVSAQYYRDPDQLPLYLERNRFLTDINNERPDGARNATYARHLAALNKLVLVLFSQDETVVPKESSWFGSYAPQDADHNNNDNNDNNNTKNNTKNNGARTVIPMRLQPLYVNDTIGLRTLDERGDLVLETCEGEHMRIGDCWRPLLERYTGGVLQDVYDDYGGSGSPGAQSQGVLEV